MDVIKHLLVSEGLRAAGYLSEDEILTDDELAARWTMYADEIRNTNEQYRATECCICFERTRQKWKSSDCSHPNEICQSCWVNIIYTACSNDTFIVQCPICRARVDSLECVE